ncbi:glycosyltransferase [Maribacter sp. CXY002]|uniref:glycosyltransferase n=1 Tax=Maribacter luteocoastalis TaxID=3407671 RepID=UPI003B68006B
MKKVLQINTVAGFGSTGRIADNIGEQAKQQNWESFLAYGRKEGKSTSQLFKIENKLGNFYHLVMTRLTDKHGLGSTNATKKFIKYIQDLNPDIIHLHNIHGYYLNYKLLFDFLNNLDTPLVWTLHDCWSFTGHCSYFDFVECGKWKEECNQCPQLHSYPKSYVDNSLSNYQLKKKLFSEHPNLTIVPVSNWLGDLVSESFLGKHRKKIIHNGVDTDSFKPKKINVSVQKKYNLNNKFIILGVASIWEKRKGLDDFITLSKMISEHEVIVLVGLNSTQLKELPNNIIGISRTDSINELAELYSTAGVFFNPTYEDNFPTTNLESLSCGTPVITYNTGGSPEAISSDSGFTVAKGDLSHMLECVSTIQKLGKAYFSDNCRKRVIHNFEMKNQFLKYIDLYNSLI